MTGSGSMLRFYTRNGCPLCDKGLAVLQPIAEGAGYTIEIIDIDLDLALLERYNDRVPVIEALDGSVVDEGIIAPRTVESALRNP